MRNRLNMDVSKLRKAITILKRQGVRRLAYESYSHIVSSIRGYLSYKRGGLSSRPWIRNFAGFLRPIFNFWYGLQNPAGINPMEKDWDNLIILDACRYDDFSDINQIPGKLIKEYSRAADSRQFVTKNFNGNTYHDTVYVTANPHYQFIDDGVFHAINTNPVKEWDQSKECVPPSAVTKGAIRSHGEYPDKKLVVHYMQPHDPPIGPTAEQIRDEIGIGGTDGPNQDSEEDRIMELVAAGEISVQDARTMYRENLQIVLDEVEKLLDVLDGKTVITADHGEMFGEKPYPILGKLYEHYQHPRTPKLCEIPWFVVEGDSDRRQVRKEDPQNYESASGEELEEQLSALGYR